MSAVVLQFPKSAVVSAQPVANDASEQAGLETAAAEALNRATGTLMTSVDQLVETMEGFTQNLTTSLQRLQRADDLFRAFDAATVLAATNPADAARLLPDLENRLRNLLGALAPGP